MPTQPAVEIGFAVPCRDPNWRDLGREIDAALEAGVSLVELPLYWLDIVAGRRIMRERLADVAAITRGRGARYSLHGHLGINLMEASHRLALHRDLFAVNIEIAATLEAPHLVVHTGLVGAESAADLENAYARQREALHAAGDIARAAGVTICVENVYDYTGRRLTALPGRLARELAAIGHPNVRATFDFSHGLIQSTAQKADFMAEAQALSPHACHLHIHDSFGSPRDFWVYSETEALAFGAGDLHLPVGWGSVPFDQIAADCRFPARVQAIIELDERYNSEMGKCIAATRGWVGRLRCEVVG
jgi:sugar phosphate isomerase/epimerase